MARPPLLPGEPFGLDPPSGEHSPVVEAIRLGLDDWGCRVNPVVGLWQDRSDRSLLERAS